MKYILQCEDSVEGIFSAVYVAWEPNYVNTELSICAINPDSPPDMELFATYVKLETDVTKASKVIHTIQSKYSAQLWEMLYSTACSDGSDKADVVFHFVQLILSMGNRAINYLSNPYVIRAMELSRSVGNERHHYLGFLRFIETPQKILLAKFDPKNNITAMVMPHFSDRLSQECFIVWDTRRNLAGVHISGNDYYLMYLSEEQVSFLQQFQEDKFQIEDLWKVFVESISIKERENKNLQRNNLPLRFRSFMTEFQK